MSIPSLTVRRHYDQVISAHYDRDVQSVLGNSLDRAMAQLRTQGVLTSPQALNVLDVGMGTGLFLEKLLAAASCDVRPFGLDLSAQMVAIARRRVPGLAAAVDDAANLEAHFDGQSFELVCTHFITGFVPMAALAPVIRSRLRDNGFWSLVGGTKAGFPALQEAAGRELVRLAFGGKRLEVGEIACNPAGREEVVSTLEAHGFSVAAAETFKPALRFEHVDDLVDFGYRGGWLTPFVEALGLHQAGKTKRMLVNLLCFPIEDHHNIEIVLAQKKRH